MKVLHLASFRGNIGDAASHIGTRSALQRHIGPAEFTELEIRRFYRNSGELAFDDAFVEQANRHDLLLVGGGNFFELWVPDSRTGMTIEIDAEMMERITTPIVFYGVGCDDYRGAPPENVERFARFLEVADDAPHVMVSVRNDGSRANIARLLGAHYADAVDVVPDGAFLVPQRQPFAQRSSRIAVNVAQDKLGEDFGHFAPVMAEAIERLMMRTGDHVVFVPHVYSDLEAIGRVMAHMDDRTRRERARVALYSSDSAEAAVLAYRLSLLTIGMRLHANIISLSQGTSTIGLGVTPKLAGLYGELGAPERQLDVEAADFVNRLEALAHEPMPSKVIPNADAFLSRVPALLREAVLA